MAKITITEVSNEDDFIDSRDLMAYIESIEGDYEEGEAMDRQTDADLSALREFAKEFEDHAPDYHYGEVAIRESYFEVYARQTLEDCGMIPSNLPGFIENNIDWSGVAEDMLVDYSEIDFDGVTYYVR